ncbi:EF-hand domain-containing protein [Bdellovibrio sp. GT3]|uniref:EF-hand domain-containing protein n=1 Tax=Bdellovibrio sp. GT3 TaxID=3136282 RepID=UPI0030F00D3C
MKLIVSVAVVLLFAACSTKAPSDRYIINSIKTADLDSSKSISRNEFKMYFQGRFSQIDAGDTGKLSAKKLCPAILAERICEGADVNQDKYITIDELYNRLDGEFDRVNKDGKGDISYKEFHEALLP